MSEEKKIRNCPYIHKCKDKSVLFLVRNLRKADVPMKVLCMVAFNKYCIKFNWKEPQWIINFNFRNDLISKVENQRCTFKLFPNAALMYVENLLSIGLYSLQTAGATPNSDRIITFIYIRLKRISFSQTFKLQRGQLLSLLRTRYGFEIASTPKNLFLSFLHRNIFWFELGGFLRE